ncbi:MAG TPA: EI24 domain-containing protein [Bacteriovoracaceae bacterium]|nr:EI24 domain-containing protein [Bacteriovoracaceae bacterium]
MNEVKLLPISLRLIFKDPINLLLAVIPTLLALSIYIFLIVLVFKNSDYFGVFIQNWIPDPQTAGWVGKIITAIFIIFMFLVTSWTFILVSGIISAPFNSLLSSRIEEKLSGKKVSEDKKSTFKSMLKDLGSIFVNEVKKMIFIVILTGLAFLLNLFPLFYPIGIFLLALVLSIQFVDYSWSRHEMTFSQCISDLFRNILSYGGYGLVFLVLITIPIINALVPALATSFFTVLWLERQKKRLTA